MDRLRRMTERELFQVKDFTVHHTEHGWIRWEGLTDVRALDLDQIVMFEHGKVEVYDDDIADKPEEGHFLNKFATIRLTAIWSPEVEKAAEAPQNALTESMRTEYQKQWGRMLQEHCASNHTKFQCYDQLKGDWTFQVEHFTIYGLPGAKQKSPRKQQKAAAAAAAARKMAGGVATASTLIGGHGLGTGVPATAQHSTATATATATARAVVGDPLDAVFSSSE